MIRRTSNGGKGFRSIESWERIKEHNEKAADPNVPEVQYTYVDKAVAARAGRKGGLAKPTEEVKARISLANRVNDIARKIQNGEHVSDKKINLLLEKMNNPQVTSATIQEKLDELIRIADGIEDDRDRAVLIDKVIGRQMEILKMQHKTEENIRRKIPLEQLNQMMKERREEKKKETNE